MDGITDSMDMGLRTQFYPHARPGIYSVPQFSQLQSGIINGNYPLRVVGMNPLCVPSVMYFFFHLFLDLLCLTLLRFYFILEHTVNDAVLISDVQQSDSVTHVSILFPILFPFRLLHNVEQSSTCYTVDPC